MIFTEVCKLSYLHIMRTETSFIVEYKMNPFELFQNISIRDFDAYVHGIIEELNKKNKEKNNTANKKTLGSMLTTLRDYLVYMTS